MKNINKICIWFTGLSGSGKTTTALALSDLLKGKNYKVELLDGDILRKTLSADLGYSKEDRDKHNLRIARYILSKPEENIIVIVATINPYHKTRSHIRSLLEPMMQFIEVYVSTPIEICESRDPKGLYQKARHGEIKNFTGIDDVYDIPTNMELTIDTEVWTSEENAKVIFDYCIKS